MGQPGPVATFAAQCYGAGVRWLNQAVQAEGGPLTFPEPIIDGLVALAARKWHKLDEMMDEDGMVWGAPALLGTELAAIKLIRRYKEKKAGGGRPPTAAYAPSVNGVNGAAPRPGPTPTETEIPVEEFATLDPGARTRGIFE